MSESSTPTEPKRVVLIAGLEDGRMAIEFLLTVPDLMVSAVFCLQDGAAGPSGQVGFGDLVKPPVLRPVVHIKDHVDDLRALQPDLIIVVGFSQIIGKDILDIPPLGVIGFHSAVLPGRRGCSPIIWAIVDGLTETGVTMFYMDEKIDTGDIVGVARFAISPDDQAADVLDKANQATLDLLKTHIDDLLADTAPRRAQDSSAGIYTRKRGAADGEIDWSQPAVDIVNLIRALSPPYPMAHTFGGDGTPILIEKATARPDLALPSPRRRDTAFRKTVLCVVAHPDDEVLGIGGTLIRHADAGSDVFVLILSEGEANKLQDTPRSTARRQSALDAAEIMGTKEVIFHDLPDQMLDSLPLIKVIKPIEEAIRAVRPAIIYTHHGGDANSDHNTVFRATFAACRPMSTLGAGIERLLTFETPSSTDQAPQIGDFVFAPNSFVDVTGVWDRKRAALECYPSEMIGGIHPRSHGYVKALARMRGGHAGIELAEALVLARERMVAFDD
jgi:methionyl-tRNA formyltransferase